MNDRTNTPAHDASECGKPEPLLTGCPPWCGLEEDRHQFEHLSPIKLVRTHTLNLGEVTRQVERFDSSEPLHVTVDVDVDETLEVTTKFGAIRRLTPAFVVLDVEQGVGISQAVLDAAQARRVAAMLLAAAEKLVDLAGSE